jgi:hypothetical protein
MERVRHPVARETTLRGCMRHQVTRSTADAKVRGRLRHAARQSSLLVYLAGRPRHRRLSAKPVPYARNPSAASHSSRLSIGMLMV